MTDKFEMTPEEFKRRIDKVTMLRETTRKLRDAAREAYRRGEIDWEPAYDIRTDHEYWRRLAAEHDAKSLAE